MAGMPATRMTTGVWSIGTPIDQLYKPKRETRPGAAAAPRRAKKPPKDVPNTWADGQLEGVEKIGDQVVGCSLHRIDVGLSCGAGHRIAQPAAGSVEHDAPEPAKALHQVDPAGPADRRSVNQHDGRPLTDLLDPHGDVQILQMDPLLGRFQPERLPQPSLDTPIARLIRRHSAV